MSPADLTARHRAQQLVLRRATVNAMAALWPRLDWANLDATYPGFAVLVGALVEKNRKTSVGLAAAYLRAFRKASGLPDFPPVLAAAFPRDEFDRGLHATTVAAAKKHAADGEGPEAMVAVGGLAAGAVARLVLNGGRETVSLTTQADPEAEGFVRVLGGGGCDFCRALADGSVFQTDFESHNHCGCSSEPKYR